MGFIAKRFFKPEFYLVLMMKNQKTLHVFKNIKLKKLQQMVSVGKKQYIIDLNHPTYLINNKRYYHVNMETGFKYTFEEVEHCINADDLDVIVGNKIIRELTAGVMDNKKQMILYMVVGCILGLLLGLVIMNFVMNNKIDELYQSFISQNQKIPFPSIFGG